MSRLRRKQHPSLAMASLASAASGPTVTLGLLIILLLSLRIMLPGAAALRLGVRNLYHNGSHLLPEGCDKVCASLLRSERLFGGRRTGDVADSRAQQRKAELLLNPMAVTRYRWPFPEYFIRILTGGDQVIELSLDTGSRFMWFQCKPCKPCYPQTQPIYAPGKSNTSRRIRKDETFCTSLQKSMYGAGETDQCCAYSVKYADGTTSWGCAITDILTLVDGDRWTALTIPGVSFGCSTSSVLRSQSATSGNLGLSVGSGGISLPEQLGDLGYGKSFSYCLPSLARPNSGFLILGSKSIPFGNGFPTTPFVKGSIPEIQYIHVIGIKINDVAVPNIPSGTFDLDPKTGKGATLIDIGSSLSSVSSEIYMPFREEWRKALANLGFYNPVADYTQLDTCYSYPYEIGLPKLEFSLVNGQSFVPARSATAYIYYTTNYTRRMCWAFYQHENSTDGALLLAGTMVESIRMFYNAIDQTLGWLYNRC